MKRLFIILLSLISTTAVFAQKAKDEIETKTPVVTYVCPMHPDITSSKAGKCSKCNMDLVSSDSGQTATNGSGKYVCPMHANVTIKDGGKCAKCNSKMVVERRGSKQSAAVWSCPMHAGSKSATPASCPKCGMAMEKKKRTKN